MIARRTVARYGAESLRPFRALGWRGVWQPGAALRSAPGYSLAAFRAASGIFGMVQKRGLTSEPTLDYDPENGFRRGACPRF